MQQLGVGGDEAQLLLAGAELEATDHLVTVGERDHLPVVAVEPLGADPLDHAMARPECESG